MLYSFPSMLLPNNVIYLPFLYLKTFKQDYLISFHSLHLFSTPFHYLNTFIPLWFNHSIPLWTLKRSIGTFKGGTTLVWCSPRQIIDHKNNPSKRGFLISHLLLHCPLVSNLCAFFLNLSSQVGLGYANFCRCYVGVFGWSSGSSWTSTSMEDNSNMSYVVYLDGTKSLYIWGGELSLPNLKFLFFEDYSNGNYSHLLYPCFLWLSSKIL